MKIYSLPRIASIIEEHSICQPGLPFPQGDSQYGSFSFENFQRAKSSGAFLSSSNSTLVPEITSFFVLPDNNKYSSNFEIS